MPDASIISHVNVKPRELNQGGTSTSEVVFSSDGTIAACLPINVNQLVGSGTGTSGRTCRFTVRANGRVTGGGTTNFTPQLQWGTSITPTSNTDIDSSAAVAVNSATGFWFLEADLLLTSDGLLDGVVRHMVSGSTRTFTDWAAASSSVTGISTTSTTSTGFVVTGTFSSGFAANTAYLDNFEIVK